MARNKEFEISEKIELAMHVFWEKGYHETSLNDLIEATGLQKGSLYNTFESKEELFLKALNHYGSRSQAKFYNGKDHPLQYLKMFFKRLINDGTHPDNSQKGCLIMNTRLEFGNNNSSSAKLSGALMDAIQNNFKNTLKEAQNRQLIPLNINLNKSSARLLVAAFSIKEISKFNQSKSFLTDIANQALKEFNINL
jgi:TetR/AcrR family transcriptional regulator, transcriptional repressor for nem operon